MISKIIQAFQTDVVSGKMECRKFFENLKKEPSELAIEFYRWVVSTYEYEMNSDFIKATFHQLAHLRDIPSLLKLERLQGIWENMYLSEYEYLLELLRNAESGAKCNCNVYQDGRFNVPPYQDDLEIIGRRTGDNDSLMQTDILTVKCNICETEWDVEIDYSYHYPHSHWRKMI